MCAIDFHAMRLTNIAQLRLPPGTVHSYGVRVQPWHDRPLPVSFDQGRHVGAGDRPGSWMAISFRIPPASHAEIAAAWDAVVARHATLRTVFSPADPTDPTPPTTPASGDIPAANATPARPRVRLHDGDASPGVWAQHPVLESTSRTVREVFDAHCRPFGEPSHRLCLIDPAPDPAADPAADPAPEPDPEPDPEPHPAPAPDPRPILVIGSDHAHVDMWSLVVIARDLALVLGGEPLPGPVEGFAAHTAELDRMPPAPPTVHEAWRHTLDAAGGVMPRFPLPLGDVSRPRAEVVEVRDVLDAEGMRRLTRRADADCVRVTAVALSVLAEVSQRLSGTPLRAVFPVHSRNDPRWHEAVGWFITNAVIECPDPSPVACAAAVLQALALGSHPLAPILAPWGGMPVTPGMFAISWLDLRRLPVAPPAGSDAHWVSAVIRTDGVMIWFVVDDTGMHLRCRYPDTPEARASVGTWLDTVEEGLRQAAA